MSKNLNFNLTQFPNLENIFKVIDLSIYYRVKDLEIICSKFILSQMKYDNVFNYLNYVYIEIEKQKLRNNSVYHEILSQIVDFISKNLDILISQKKRELLELKNELFQFIIEKCVPLLVDNYANKNFNFNNFFELLMKRKNVTSIFELLNIEIKREIDMAIKNIKSNINCNENIIPCSHQNTKSLFQSFISESAGFEIVSEIKSSKVQIYLKYLKYLNSRRQKMTLTKKTTKQNKIISNGNRNYRSVSPKKSNISSNHLNHKPFGFKKYSNPSLLKGVKNCSLNNIFEVKRKYQKSHHSKSNSSILKSNQRGQNDYLNLNSPSQSNFSNKNSVQVSEESSKIIEDPEMEERDSNFKNLLIHSMIIFLKFGLDDSDGKVDIQLLSGYDKTMIREIEIDRKIKNIKCTIYIHYNYIISFILSYIIQNMESKLLYCDKKISFLPYFILKFLLARLNSDSQKNIKRKYKGQNSLVFQILSNWFSTSKIIIDNEKKNALLNLIEWVKYSPEEIIKFGEISNDQFAIDYINTILEAKNIKKFIKPIFGNGEPINLAPSYKKQIDTKSEDLSEVKEESGCTESVDNNYIKYYNKMNIINEETNNVKKAENHNMGTNLNENLLKKKIPANSDLNNGTKQYFNLQGTVFPSPSKPGLAVYNNSSFVQKDSFKSLITNELFNSLEENTNEANSKEDYNKEKSMQNKTLKFEKSNPSLQKNDKKYLIRLNDLQKLIN